MEKIKCFLCDYLFDADEPDLDPNGYPICGDCARYYASKEESNG